MDFFKLLCSIVVAIFADIDEFLMYNRFSAIVVCRSSNTSYNSTDTCSSARTHSYDNLLIVRLNWTVNSGHNVCLSIYLINFFYIYDLYYSDPVHIKEDRNITVKGMFIAKADGTYDYIEIDPFISVKMYIL